MQGYGRDYDNGGRNWFERAGETVRGWFGAGGDYDRDYGYGGNARAMHRDEWHNGGYRGGDNDWSGGYGGGPRMNNWNNQHSTLDTVRRAAGGYYGADYEDRGGYSGGGSGWGRGNDYGRDYNTGWNGNRGGQYGAQGGMNRGRVQRFTAGGQGGMNRGGGMGQGGMRDTWQGGEYGGGGYGNDWGDYNRGGYGGNAFRNSRSGGVEPGRYFNGYGHGSTSGNGYEPY
jgi:hypothetical protein